MVLLTATIYTSKLFNSFSSNSTGINYNFLLTIYLLMQKNNDYMFFLEVY
jgi:hypothetical protein